MVEIATWEEFRFSAEQLYKKRPENTRWFVKYRHRDQTLVAKVTDDIQVRKILFNSPNSVLHSRRTNLLTFLRSMRWILGLSRTCLLRQRSWIMLFVFTVNMQSKSPFIISLIINDEISHSFLPVPQTHCETSHKSLDSESECHNRYPWIPSKQSFQYMIMLRWDWICCMAPIAVETLPRTVSK